jgi:large subunit ribosomal protein L10
MGDFGICGSPFLISDWSLIDSQKGASILPISKARKEELVAEYRELLEQSNGFALVEAIGMSVAQTQNLRKKVYEAGGKYVVGKNTLIRIALEQAGWAVPTDELLGPTAIIFGRDDFPNVAKSVLNFIKDENLSDKLAVKGGVLGGQEILSGADVVTVSELPSLPEMQAQIIGLIVAPSRNLVTILQQAESGVVNVLQAWLDKDEAGSDDAA